MMRPILASNNKGGFTLIEVMVSLAIISIVFLGLTDTSIVALDYNLNNQIREEAVQIADFVMDNNYRNANFATLASVATPVAAPRNIRGKGVPYTWTSQVEFLDGNNRRVTVAVSWPSRSYKSGKWQPVNKSHTVVSVISAGTGLR